MRELRLRHDFDLRPARPPRVFRPVPLQPLQLFARDELQHLPLLLRIRLRRRCLPRGLLCLPLRRGLLLPLPLLHPELPILCLGGSLLLLPQGLGPRLLSTFQGAGLVQLRLARARSVTRAARAGRPRSVFRSAMSKTDKMARMRDLLHDGRRGGPCTRLLGRLLGRTGSRLRSRCDSRLRRGPQTRNFTYSKEQKRGPTLPAAAVAGAADEFALVPSALRQKSAA